MTEHVCEQIFHSDIFFSQGTFFVLDQSILILIRNNLKGATITSFFSDPMDFVCKENKIRVNVIVFRFRGDHFYSNNKKRIEKMNFVFFASSYERRNENFIHQKQK